MNKALLLNLIVCFTLTACGGGGGGSNGDSPTDNGNGKDNISDFTPDDFFFLEAANHETSVEVASNEITLSGLSLDTPISVENGLYSINGATPMTEASTVTSGDTVKVFLTTSDEYQTTTTAVLTVGTLAVELNATTREKDITPEVFPFIAQDNAELITDYISSGANLTGLDNDTVISISSGAYSINSGEFTAANGTVSSGDNVRILLTSSSDYASLTSATLTVGSVSASYNITTRNPASYALTAQENAELASQVVSNTITLSEIKSDTSISIENGLYSVNSAEFTAQPSQVNPGDTLTVQLLSASEFETQSQAVISLGSSNVSFSVTTREKDITPDAFELTEITNAELNSEVASNTVTISGIDDNTPFIFMGSKYTLNGVEFTGGSDVVGGTINNGDELTAYLMTGSVYSNLYTGGFQIGTENNEFLFQVTTKADTAPTVTFAKELADDGSTTLTGREELVLNFSETMQTDTLVLSGDMVPDCNDLSDETSCLNLVWSENDTVLTMSPKEDFYWYADERLLQVAITGDGPLGLDETMSATVLPVFETFQAADVVIGQADFNSNQSGLSNRQFNGPVHVSTRSNDGNTSLLVTDKYNNRVLKYKSVPTKNNAISTEFYGQLDLDSNSVYGNNDNQLKTPQASIEFKDKIYIADNRNKRAVWVDNENFSVDGLAESSGKAVSLVGQSDFSMSMESEVCSKEGLASAYTMELVETRSGTKWLVSDGYNDRILIWDNPSELKGAAASMVLGQTSFDNCVRYSEAYFRGIESILRPEGIWSNSEKLIVADTGNNRILVWNEFPSKNNQLADFQIGQLDEWEDIPNTGTHDTISQRGLDTPKGMGGNAYQICLSDSDNNRVLFWSSLPESTDDLADIVIGQSDFTKAQNNDIDQDGNNDSNINGRVLSNPVSCDISMEQLFIADSGNHRVLVYNALNKRPINN